MAGNAESPELQGTSVTAGLLPSGKSSVREPDPRLPELPSSLVSRLQRASPLRVQTAASVLLEDSLELSLLKPNYVSESKCGHNIVQKQ